MKRIRTKFWHVLEGNPRRIATLPDWKRAAGSEYGLFQNMIHPVEGLATRIADPEDIDGLRLLVVDYGNGEYSAIDSGGNRCIPVMLEDIIRHTLNLNEFRFLTSEILGFEPASDVIPPNSVAPIRFGSRRIKPGMEFPVYLILAPEPQLMADRLLALLMTERKPFFLLTATRWTWSPEIQQLVHDRQSQLVALEECLLVDNDGHFAKSETWDNAVSAFRAIHCPDDPVTASPSYEFRKKGSGWIVRFNGQETSLKDSKGAKYISLLLSKPGEPIFAADLQAIASGKDPATLVVAGNAGTMTDRETLQDIEKEARSLQADLAQARIDGNELLAQEILDAMQKLAEYAQKATDGRGKLRKASDDSDSLRIAVSQAIDRTINDIVQEIPVCGTHLRNAIRTGTMIYYESQPGISWDL